MRIGAITIGQSPQPDLLDEIITPEFKGVEFIEAGALDGLVAPQIAALAPRRGEAGLVTRLRDGSTVTVSEALLAPLVEQCLRRLEDAGAEATMLLCTASFRSLAAKRPFFRPYHLVRAVVEAVLTQGTLAVVVPDESQRESALAAWRLPGKEVISAALPPYEPSREYFTALLAVLHQCQPGLVVLDCMGYNGATQEQLTKALRLPVVSPRMVLAAVLAAFVAASPQSPHRGAAASKRQGGRK